MTSVQPINHKRSSSNLDAQQYEPPMKKSSLTCIPLSKQSSQSMEIPKSSAVNKKVFTRAPMSDFLTKYGLISRGQQVFEDLFIAEDNNSDFVQQVLPAQQNSSSATICAPLAVQAVNSSNQNRVPYSTTSLDVSFACFCSLEKKSSMKVKCSSESCLNEAEQNHSNIKKQSQQQLLETRAREESSEFSIMGDEEDQLDANHKCNFLTEQIDQSAQVFIHCSEIAQPIIVNNCEAAGNNNQENDQNFKAILNNNNQEEYESFDCQEDDCLDYKIIEFGSFI